MADNSAISWTDATWNVINGCMVLSPGCTNCYAMKLAGTRFRDHPSRSGLTVDTKAGPVWNGKAKLIEHALDQPLRWAKPRMIFVNAHGDNFYEGVPWEWVDLLIAVAALAHWHRFQFLSKRADRQRAYFSDLYSGWRALEIRRAMYRVQQSSKRKLPRSEIDDAIGKIESCPLPNLWLGISAEDQERAEDRLGDLIQTPAALHWLSAEPLLGPLDLRAVSSLIVKGGNRVKLDMLGGKDGWHHNRLGWVVAGGESGAAARPCNPDWVRSIRDQCAAAGVPFHFKQWGEWLPGEVYSKPAAEASAESRKALPDAEVFGGFARFPDLERGQIADPEFRGKPTHWWAGDCFGGKISAKVGKGIAGNLLDGIKHEAFP